MIILGLTGSIGMGKSTAANAFMRFGVPVHDADATVHALLAPGGAAVAAVAELFPDALRDGGIDRARVGSVVFAEPAKLKELEACLHPVVRRAEARFLATMARRRSRLVVLDIPLLFETGGEARVDGVVVVSAPAFVQRQRVLARPGMDVEKFAGILKKQMPDAEKRRRADFIVETGLGRIASLAAIRKIIAETRSWRGRKWPPLPVGPAIGRGRTGG